MRQAKTEGFYLIERMLRNPDERFYYSELSDDAADDHSEASARTYVRAAEDVQSKVMKQTKGAITDFLMIGTGKTGFVQINPAYLPSKPLSETSG